MAATTGRRADDLRSRVIGDGIVPLNSALGLHADPSRALSFPRSRRWIGRGLGHLDLLSRPEVYTEIKRWLGRPASLSARRGATRQRPGTRHGADKPSAEAVGAAERSGPKSRPR